MSVLWLSLCAGALGVALAQQEYMCEVGYAARAAPLVAVEDVQTLTGCWEHCAAEPACRVVTFARDQARCLVAGGEAAGDDGRPSPGSVLCKRAAAPPQTEEFHAVFRERHTACGRYRKVTPTRFEQQPGSGHSIRLVAAGVWQLHALDGAALPLKAAAPAPGPAAVATWLYSHRDRWIVSVAEVTTAGEVPALPGSSSVHSCGPAASFAPLRVGKEAAWTVSEEAAGLRAGATACQARCAELKESGCVGVVLRSSGSCGLIRLQANGGTTGARGLGALLPADTPVCLRFAHDEAESVTRLDTPQETARAVTVWGEAQAEHSDAEFTCETGALRDGGFRVLLEGLTVPECKKQCLAAADCTHAVVDVALSRCELFGGALDAAAPPPPAAATSPVTCAKTTRQPALSGLADPCACEPVWTGSASDPASCRSIPQHGCPAQACDGSSQPWCQVVDPSACPRAHYGGWAPCDRAALIPRLVDGSVNRREAAALATPEAQGCFKVTTNVTVTLYLRVTCTVFLADDGQAFTPPPGFVVNVTFVDFMDQVPANPEQTVLANLNAALAAGSSATARDTFNAFLTSINMPVLAAGDQLGEVAPSVVVDTENVCDQAPEDDELVGGGGGSVPSPVGGTGGFDSLADVMRAALGSSAAAVFNATGCEELTSENPNNDANTPPAVLHLRELIFDTPQPTPEPTPEPATNPGPVSAKICFTPDLSDPRDVFLFAYLFEAVQQATPATASVLDLFPMLWDKLRADPSLACDVRIALGEPCAPVTTPARAAAALEVNAVRSHPQMVAAPEVTVTCKEGGFAGEILYEVQGVVSAMECWEHCERVSGECFVAEFAPLDRSCAVRSRKSVVIPGKTGHIACVQHSTRFQTALQQAHAAEGFDCAEGGHTGGVLFEVQSVADASECASFCEKSGAACVVAVFDGATNTCSVRSATAVKTAAAASDSVRVSCVRRATPAPAPAPDTAPVLTGYTCQAGRYVLGELFEVAEVESLSACGGFCDKAGGLCAVAEWDAGARSCKLRTAAAVFDTQGAHHPRGAAACVKDASEPPQEAPRGDAEGRTGGSSSVYPLACEFGAERERSGMEMMLAVRVGLRECRDMCERADGCVYLNHGAGAADSCELFTVGEDPQREALVVAANSSQTTCAKNATSPPSGTPQHYVMAAFDASTVAAASCASQCEDTPGCAGVLLHPCTLLTAFTTHPYATAVRQLPLLHRRGAPTGGEARGGEGLAKFFSCANGAQRRAGRGVGYEAVAAGVPLVACQAACLADDRCEYFSYRAGICALNGVPPGGAAGAPLLQCDVLDAFATGARNGGAHGFAAAALKGSDSWSVQEVTSAIAEEACMEKCAARRACLGFRAGGRGAACSLFFADDGGVGAVQASSVVARWKPVSKVAAAQECVCAEPCSSEGTCPVVSSACRTSQGSYTFCNAARPLASPLASALSGSFVEPLQDGPAPAASSPYTTTLPALVLAALLLLSLAAQRLTRNAKSVVVFHE
ncbi:hypothetical protein DIPPA_30965 [Diplonema papillatum]|nr:hypothetical protein DIPPA_30965 [Diplonema papillatum]